MLNITRDPVRVIGIVASIVVAIITTLVGQGVISEVQAGQANNIVTDVVGVLTILAPWIAAEISRLNVTPTAAPKLPVGTAVLLPSQPDNAAPQGHVQA